MKVLTDNPYVRHAHVAAEDDGKGNLRHVAIVLTDIVLSPLEPGYDEQSFTSLTAAAAEYLRNNSHAQAVVFERGTGGSGNRHQYEVNRGMI